MKALTAIPFLVFFALTGCGGGPVDGPEPESKQEDVGTAASELRANCEGALASCMNHGGGTDACWNAYWRCSGGNASSVNASQAAGQGKIQPERAPICLEGEKLHCTLGPPPVCSCQ